MIREYIDYLVTLRGYSMKTATSYESDLRDFSKWLQANRIGARWSTITRDDIDAYISDLVSRQYKPSTTNRRLAAISGLYRYMQRQGMEVVNPCKYESRRKEPQTIPNTIPTADLQQAYEHSTGVVRVMLGLLATTGIRIAELLALRWEDVDSTTGALVVNGKGSKQRIVYTTSELYTLLGTIRETYDKHGQIFGMTDRQARRMIWAALKPYSRAPQLSPHAIRHTFATTQASAGTNTTTLAHMLGHSDIKTTQRYVDMTQSQARTAFAAYNPLNV